MAARSYGDLDERGYRPLRRPNSRTLVSSMGLGRSAVPRPRHGAGAVVTDPEIVAGLQRGEAWAADQLYRRVHRSVHRALERLLRYDDHELEDLMQEAFERIISVLSERSLTGPCHLPGWASAVTAHLALDRLRKRTRERKLVVDRPPEEGVSEAAGPSLERGLEARQRLARVQATLARMRPKYVETLLMHDVLGHELSEIAALTGVSVAAAQSRLVRGRKEFQRRAAALGGRP